MAKERANHVSRILDDLLSRRAFAAIVATFGTLSLAAPMSARKKKKKKKKKKPTCAPESQAATCAGQRCGSVTNNCSQQVNCGACVTYVFDSKWGGSGSGDGRLRQPRGVAVDSAGDVYVADTNNNRVQKYSNSGQYLDQWGAPGSGVEFSLPYSVSVDPQGSIFVADFGNNRVVKLSGTGNFMTAWDTAADAEDTLDGPRAVSVDASNTVCVSDFNNHRVLTFSSTGGFQTEIDAFFVSPTGVVSNGGTLYVVDAFANKVFRIPGSPIGGDAGSGEGEFSGPSSVALDSDGSILVTDSQNDRFQKFDADGNFLTSVAMPAVGAGESSQPLGIAVDGDGNVFIANINNDSIQKFRPAAAVSRAAGATTSRAAPNIRSTRKRDDTRLRRR